MNEDGVKSVNNKIRATLNSVEVNEGVLNFGSVHDPLAKLFAELEKTKSKWIEITDIYFIFFRFVHQSYLDNDAHSTSYTGLLKNFLSRKEIDKTQDIISEYILSIPRNYDVLIPIPRLWNELKSNIKLSGNFEIVSIQATKINNLGAADKNLTDPNYQPGLYLKMRVSGYFNGSQNSTIGECLTAIKIIMQQGLLKRIFIKDASFVHSDEFFADRFHPHVPKTTIICQDLSGSLDEAPLKIDLDIEMSDFLNSIEINLNSDSIKKAIGSKVLSNYIRASLHGPINLIESKDDEAGRIRSAIEWCFDSIINKDLRMSYLQICIGLEAILGDGVTESITKTLADRCAYVVCDDLRQRANVKEKFKKFYKLRGKLVHGAEFSLGGNVTSFKSWGRQILEIAIGKEMQLLKVNNPRLTNATK